ncbi:MAG: polysaccharide biosynthesis tyrosine autokinase [Propioniciclava sp.]
MTLDDLVRVLRMYLRSIIVVFLVVSAGGVGAYMLQTPVYTSSSTINFLPQSGGSAGQLAAAMDYAVVQAETFAALANGPTVLEPVAESLGVSSVEGVVNAWTAGTTAAVVVTATSSDPTYAQDVAAATADQILIAVEEFSPPGSTETVAAKITKPAGLPGAPSSPNLFRGLPVILLIGAAVALGQAFLRAALDNSVERAEDVARATKHPVIGEIPYDRSGAAHANSGGRSVQAFALRSEAYRRLRTNLQFLMLTSDSHTVVVTSSIPGEGKTETSAHMAETMAETGSRVLLVDCDLRRPQVAKHYDLDNAVGLTSALLHGTPVADLVQNVDGLDVLTSGPVPPNPSELLGSVAMKQILATASKDYDLIMLDTPPLLPVTDGTILAQQAGGAMVIADVSRVKRGQLKQAMGSLDAVDAPVFGVVLNKLRPLSGAYGYSYSYSYGPDRKSKSTASGRRSNGATKAKSSRRGSRGR